MHPGVPSHTSASSTIPSPHRGPVVLEPPLLVVDVLDDPESAESTVVVELLGSVVEEVVDVVLVEPVLTGVVVEPPPLVATSETQRASWQMSPASH